VQQLRVQTTSDNSGTASATTLLDHCAVAVVASYTHDVALPNCACSTKYRMSLNSGPGQTRRRSTARNVKQLWYLERRHALLEHRNLLPSRHKLLFQRLPTDLCAASLSQGSSRADILAVNLLLLSTKASRAA
jgi:hypothetical protein